jgi:pimeloyl-ACP methyl ester carboxylesterase
VQGIPLALAAVALVPACMPPSWGADAILHPPRRHIEGPPTAKARYEPVDVDVGIKLSGWLFRTDRTPRRGTVVYLHGLADNRASGASVADHFTNEGFDVLAYDGRAHGESGGDACTYGFYEKQDLSRALEKLGIDRVMLFGVSLGAGIALQAAPDDPRVRAVIAVASISDLRTAANERAPFLASRRNIDEAFRIAEEKGRFRIDGVSPVAAAARIHVPVLLIHGAEDKETPPAHSQRIYAALAGPKQLVLVPHATHATVLNASAWKQIDDWVAATWPAR